MIACLLASPAACRPSAALKVLATTPDWGALTQELGGERVNVYVATTALQDVHRVEAKPSLVARARSADLVVATGAELEVGWLPVLIQESGNARIQPGAPGYFEAASALRLLEVPSKLDRSMGDIHPQGNPHVQLDPHNIAAGGARADRAARAARAAQAAYYAARGKDFDARWNAAITAWEAKAAPLKGVHVVIMHRDQAYLCHWLGLVEVASIEPKPGVPPTAAYLGSAGRQADRHAAEAHPAQCLQRSEGRRTGCRSACTRRRWCCRSRWAARRGAKDLFGLFDDTLNKLLAAIK